MLDLHRLHLLHEFSVHGTITAVASSLGYSPSTVSQQLSLLRQEVGAELFVRAGRTLKLTPMGMRLAAHAKTLLDMQEAILDDISSPDQELTGLLRISVIQSAALAAAPSALGALRGEHPELRVAMAQAAPEQALEDLAGRRYDLVMAEQYPGMSRSRQAEFDVAELGSDPLQLVVPEQLRSTPAEDLDAFPWVMEPEGTAAREWSLQQCRSLGFEPDIRFSTADLSTHLRLIAAGLAVGILPGLFLSAQQVSAVAVRPLPRNPQRTIFTTTRRSSSDSPAVQACRTAFAEAFHQALTGT